MRPDEHKKKNSAKYKKKHGINPAERKATIGEKTNKVASKEGTAAGVHVVSNTISDKDDVTEVGNNSQKSYSRRPLTSNWEKYNEPIEEIEQIGADFNELIASAGGVDSHLVLASEKSWNVNQELDDILSINFDKLADSLGNLPFCERLGLDERQFEPSLLKLLNSSKNSSDDASDSFPIQSLSLRNYDFDFQSVSKKESSSAPSSVDETKTELKNGKEIEIAEESHQISVNDSKLPTAPDAIQEAANNLKATEPIEDGEILATALSAVVERSTPSKDVQKFDDLELELDALLIGGSDTTLQGKIKEISNVCDSKIVNNTKENLATGADQTSKEQDDLEDWLDSII